MRVSSVGARLGLRSPTRWTIRQVTNCSASTTSSGTSRERIEPGQHGQHAEPASPVSRCNDLTGTLGLPFRPNVCGGATMAPVESKSTSTRSTVLLTPVDVPKASDVLARELRERILSGELTEGTALPAERGSVKRTHKEQATASEGV